MSERRETPNGGPADTPGAATPSAPAFVPDDALMPLLADWLPHQRWCGADESSAPEMTLSRREQIAVTESGTRVELAWVRLGPAPDAPRYQVVLGWRTTTPPSLEHAIIGLARGVTCYDALHDREVTALLLAHLRDGERLGPLLARSAASRAPDTSAPGLVSSGEQSNTSIVFGDSVIMKVFRRIEPGRNPDAELSEALTEAESAHSAPVLGEWTIDANNVATTVALATRYFTDGVDGWAMATTSTRDLMAEDTMRAAEAGGDFAGEATRLGEAVGQVHLAMAERLGTDSVPRDEVRDVLDGMATRARATAAQVPDLAAHLSAIEQTYQRIAATISAPMEVQRIHGDLHLGQCLRTVGGWILIDFEGEPLRPLAERRQPQSPLKDVAGMLRSFDYAAHHHGVAAADDAHDSFRAADWAMRNQAAFCAGYATATARPLAASRQQSALLRAFQLDKAVYEVEYEHLHRPGWEPIPLGAVARLAARPSEHAP